MIKKFPILFLAGFCQKIQSNLKKKVVPTVCLKIHDKHFGDEKIGPI
jgi:hypothetical protein